MNYSFTRITCANCHESLPRAAAHRCPLCRAPVSLAGFGANAICPHCDAFIPRAHAGHCPLCAIPGFIRSGIGLSGGHRQ